jgi:hypothetical protein
MRLEAEAKAQDDSDEVDYSSLKKSNYNVDDITMDLDKQMKISKKKGPKNVEMQPASRPIQKGEKIKALREKRKSVKSRS